MGKLIIRMLIKCGITLLVAKLQRIATEMVNYRHGHIHTTLLGSKPGPFAKYPSRCPSPSLPPNFLLTKENVKNRRDHSFIHPKFESSLAVNKGHHSRINMDLVPRTSIQMANTPMEQHIYTNTLTATTNLFHFMHQDPKPVVRVQLQILSL